MANGVKYEYLSSSVRIPQHTISLGNRRPLLSTTQCAAVKICVLFPTWIHVPPQICTLFHVWMDTWKMWNRIKNVFWRISVATASSEAMTMIDLQNFNKKILFAMQIQILNECYTLNICTNTLGERKASKMILLHICLFSLIFQLLYQLKILSQSQFIGDW